MNRANELQQKILEAMKDLQVWDVSDTGNPPEYRINDDECPLMTYAALEKKLGQSRPRLKVEMLELRDDGLVELSPSVDQDYMPNGSGWILTEKSLDYFLPLNEQAKPLNL